MKNQTESHSQDVLLGDERTDKPIKFKALDNIYWDDWGHMRLVFSKGEIYEGVLHSDGRITGYNAYFDVSDYVDLDKVEVEK